MGCNSHKSEMQGLRCLHQFCECSQIEETFDVSHKQIAPFGFAFGDNEVWKKTVQMVGATKTFHSVSVS